MILIFIIFYCLLSLFAAGIFWKTGELHQSFSLMLGSVLSGALFFLSYKGWKGIFEKKFVALSAGVIVIKYAILVFFVYFLSRQSWISSGWLIGGIGAFKLPLFLVALRYAKIQSSETDKTGKL